jgi:YegS/Rv2252/BmrU family lipid kinase
MNERLSTASIQQHIRDDRRAALVINTHARAGAHFAQRIFRLCTALGLRIEPYLVRNPAYLRRTVARAISTGYHFIIVGGGDGTISSVCGLFAQRGIVLGVLPLGTGNSFARSLEIPLTLAGAVHVLVHGKVAAVDLGRVGEQHFANVVDIGLSAEMAWYTTGKLKRLLGILAYPLIGIQLGWRHRPFIARLTIDGVTREYCTHEIIVANGRYYGNMILTDGASVESRHLVIYTMEAVTHWQLARIWLRLLLHRYAPLGAMAHLTADDVLVETDPPQYLDIDGEAATRTPTRFSVDPSALYVMVPESFVER